MCTGTFCVYRAAVKNKLRNYSGVYVKSHDELQKNVKKKVIKIGTIHFLLTYNDKVWLYLGSVNKLFTVKSVMERPFNFHRSMFYLFKKKRKKRLSRDRRCK